MEDYKALAIRYLSMNKKRTLVTVAGVSVAVFFLFVMLNLGWSALLHYREKTREENNYEIVLFTERSEQIEKIIADSRVKEARVGSYYHKWYSDKSGDIVGKVYPNALYIDTSNSYKMLSIMEGLKSDYEVEGTYNTDLAYSYFNGSNANVIFIGVLFLLLVSYIFAIFGVGIIRNSIQLSMLEQIKDYGNMRCIGASRSQLKTFIYIEGAIMELGGLVMGIIVGTVVSMIAGHFLGFAAGFHFLPVLFVAVAFLGDLYFAMQESCKVVVNMTPIDAVRGEYRIRKEKIKARKSGIFGKVFGVEGDYAYKNIMRSPRRFVKTVLGIGLGMSALIIGGGLGETVHNAIRESNDLYKYYQIYFNTEGFVWNTSEELKSKLPPMENVEKISDVSGVTETKRMYCSTVMLAEENIVSHVTDSFLNDTDAGSFYRFLLKEGDSEAYINNFREMNTWQLRCYGYDKEDYERYRNSLVEGTLKLSDHGLILVNGARLPKAVENEETLGTEYIDVTMTDYKLGDTVKIVDVKRLRECIRNRMEEIELENQEDFERLKILYGIACECWQQLVAEGAYETYKIEGIVAEDVNHITQEPCFILPLENYFALTGTGEADYSGIQFHVAHYPMQEKISDYMFYELDAVGTQGVEVSPYCETMEQWVSMRIYLYGILLFVFFIISISSANIINTNASNLHLRKKEFAQLRVIGISKKRLVRMVTLEGVITAIVANVIGIVIGGGIGYLLFWFIHMWTGIPYHFPLVSVLLGIFLSLVLLVGSIYFPLMGLKQDMAADLAGSGE